MEHAVHECSATIKYLGVAPVMIRMGVLRGALICLVNTLFYSRVSRTPAFLSSDLLLRVSRSSVGFLLTRTASGMMLPLMKCHLLPRHRWSRGAPRAVIMMLLLCPGDVELNPGPNYRLPCTLWKAHHCETGGDPVFQV